MCKEAATDGVKELGKLRTAAYETHDLADITATKFRKNKLIPKESTALCEEIKKAADQLAYYGNDTAQPFDDGDVKGFEEHKKKLSALLTVADKIKV